MVLPAGTETVAEAAPGLTLHLTASDETFSTGELFMGCRTAAVELPEGVTRVVQMSVLVSYC